MSKSPTEAGELPPSPHTSDQAEPPHELLRMDTVEDDSLQIHPPQQIHTKKEKSHKHKHKKSKDHRKDASRERTSSKTDDRVEKERKRDRVAKEDRYIKEDKGSRAKEDRVPFRDDRALARDDRAPGRSDRAPARDDRAQYREDRLGRDDRQVSRERPRDDRYRQAGRETGGYSRVDKQTDRMPSRSEYYFSGPKADLRETLMRSHKRNLDKEERRDSPAERDSRRHGADEASGRGREESRHDSLSRHRSRSPLNRSKGSNKASDSLVQPRSDAPAKSGSKKSAESKRDAGSKKVDVIELSGGEEGPESPSEEEEESGSEEEVEESGSEAEESGSEAEVEEGGESSSGEEVEESEESGSAEESEEEEESEQEVEQEEAEKSAESSGQSDQESRRSKKRKKSSHKSRSKDRRSHKSKFESESEAEESAEEAAPAEAANGEDDSNSEVEMAMTPEMSDPPTPPPRLPPYYPALQGCRSVDDFRHLNRIEEGTYGVVFRAEDLKQKEIVALKRLKMEKEKEGFPITSLREINTLLKTQHENIVTVREIVVGSNMDKIYLVMDFVEHDLKALMESMKTPFAIGEVKTLLLQLLKAVAHMHDNWILHRDLKTSNLLLSHKGILKVGDFGLAREYGSPLKPYTPVVVTLWYRAPELLLGCKQYSTAIDVWSVGCIFAEMLLMKALWPGKNEIDELNKIFKDMGTPTEKIWPGVSELPAMKKCNFAEYPYNTLKNRFASGLLDDPGYELLNKFLTFDPKKRVSAEDAKSHEYFDIHPLPVDPSLFPTWPARSEQPRGKKEKTPKPPSGGQAYKLLGADDAGFHLGANSLSSGFNLKF
ncbi:CDK11A [Bugula neritina]|uniref:cyclin-dependent kinase n=1 Tax=Bugula neritina TaxID=10212 RepID=A0A7J7JPI2_BUGNE|nr:CDK11A [Bugula neritina]